MEPTAAWSAALFVLALAFGALWLAMRARGLAGIRAARAKGPMEVVQRLPLTAQHSLHLVRAGDDTLWVVTFPGGAVLRRAGRFGSYLTDAAARQEANRS